MGTEKIASAANKVGHNTIDLASELGRLDFVSVLLAIIAILLVIAALPAYQIIKSRSESIAREVSEQIRAEAITRAEKAAIDMLEEKLPSLVDDYMELAKTAVSNEMADRIAQAQEDGRDDDEYVSPDK